MTIFAKSSGESLEVHIRNSLDVLCSFRKYFPNLPQLYGDDKFWEYAFISVSFHDLGKAAKGFQDSLQGSRWNYRHEILSAGFALNLKLPSPHKERIVLSILTHHLGWKICAINTEHGGLEQS